MIDLIWADGDEPIPPHCADVDLLPRRVEADHLKVFAHQAHSVIQGDDLTFFVHYVIKEFGLLFKVDLFHW